MDNMNRVELLAPAGEVDAFYGAIAAGADAIYLAGEKFGARAYAENFNTETLVSCIAYAHMHHRKVYLTVNTLLKDSEIDQLYAYILPFYEAGLDAVIVQDLGVLKYLKTAFPGLELHVSTQMTICSGYGAKLLKELGASRIVPARELSLSEIIEMKRQGDVEIESFIHGAMCYCYSGQCLFSSVLGGRSGNRGRCAQPCRLPYQVRMDGKTGEEMYPLSLKDMCTIEHIPAFIEAGIDSFKIEGRMKKPEYAAGVTDIYRRAIDRYYSLREKYGVEEAMKRYHVSNDDKKQLASLYVRKDLQDGYYYKHNGREMVTLTTPSYAGGEEQLLTQIREKLIEERLKLPVTIFAEFRIGAPASVTFLQGEESVTVYGEIVQAAVKQPLSAENVQTQLSKLGDSPFVMENLILTMDENIFYSLKAINELRRQGVDMLTAALLPDKRRDAAPAPFLKSEEKQTLVNHIWEDTAISAQSMEQLEAVHEFLMENRINCRLYVDSDLLVFHRGKVSSILESISKTNRVWTMLPYIFRSKKEMYFVQLEERLRELATMLSGVLVRSVDELGFLKERKIDLPVRLDAGMYSWNRFSVEEFSPYVEGFCLPYELNHREQVTLINMAPHVSYEKIVYGRIPMMITANCVLKTAQGCSMHSGTDVSLFDRYHKSFPVWRNCYHCYNVIYNSLPFNLLHLNQYKAENLTRRIDFTIEKKSETKALLSQIFDASGRLQTIALSGEYTTGHEKRGVE